MLAMAVDGPDVAEDAAAMLSGDMEATLLPAPLPN